MIGRQFSPPPHRHHGTPVNAAGQVAVVDATYWLVGAAAEVTAPTVALRRCISVTAAAPAAAALPPP